MTTALSYIDKTRAQQFGEDFTGGVRHRKSRLERSKSSLRWERSRRAPASRQSTPQSIPGRQRSLLQYLGREWSAPESGYARNDNPETQVRLWVHEARNNA